jgi:hypothetical protein
MNFGVHHLFRREQGDKMVFLNCTLEENLHAGNTSMLNRDVHIIWYLNCILNGFRLI